jgi:hypothetical protein
VKVQRHDQVVAVLALAVIMSTRLGDGACGDPETVTEIAPEGDGIFLAGLFERQDCIPASSCVVASGAATDVA